ncbi:cation-translocating P-type ATPase [Sediminibacterium roseum]|uniref:Cation-translocating P-type ATPase n=1 Tax=Sediminibacterium roseum TaxID=1978412 RepID=A0ABW9ZY49_9BACT|nr:cation-translocating P-type ATPase [Sediminibacterium roseum]NCI49776.1 cation-translocating P-type ATPase [Sediminibacterium roseum]
MAAFYQIGTEKVMEQLHSSPQGLQPDAIPAIRKESGENILTETKQKSKLSILLSQFTDVMILILIIAAVISFIAGEHTDAYVILAIIVANAWMGFSQESNAEESVKLLKKLSPQFALVLRNNNTEKIETSAIVPGDIIILNAGDVVPADGRLISLHSFKTDESSLTGESQSTDKTTDAIEGNALSPGDQTNMVFKGSHVTAGSAKAIVTAIGMQTELGKIATLLKSETQKTPLQKRLALFSKQLAVIVIIICAIIFGFGIWQGNPVFQTFLTALSLAVAALPEALPAVITIALAKGARRMSKQQALMKNLPAVETLGSVTYICTDKTGTLTKNTMTVEKMEAVPDKQTLLLQAMMLNNEVRFSKEGLLGDSTETALVDYALQNGITKEEADRQLPFISKLPFDSERMLMSTLHRWENKWILLVKGAPVKLIEALSPGYKDKNQEWLDKNREWASEGLRVLFFAFKIFETDPGEIAPAMEKDLDFLGAVAMIDPPREEVIEALKRCKAAGIRTVMITGDQPLTATAIANRLGLLSEGNSVVKTGADLVNLSGEDFRQAVKNIVVYARVSPQQKLDIVKALQANGEFVAMTGDGVNDAPSLRQSDIGIAMGITGTDVSKEAADMILMDDNFATIVNAIKEGRRIYDNIRKFILYVLSCNLAEILVIFFAPILGFAIPLLPIHILWINLVTDGLPGMALVAEPAEPESMGRPPRSPKENLFAGGMIPKLVWSGVVMTVSCLLVQYWGIRNGYDVKAQQTMVFTTLCFVQLGNALSVSSAQHSVFSRAMFANKSMWFVIGGTVALQFALINVSFLQVIFKTGDIDWKAVLATVIAAVASVLVLEVLKRVLKR